MRISDWSSDVCASDLRDLEHAILAAQRIAFAAQRAELGLDRFDGRKADLIDRDPCPPDAVHSTSPMRTQNAAGPTPTICVATDDTHASITIRKRTTTQEAYNRDKQAIRGHTGWETLHRPIFDWARAGERRAVAMAVRLGCWRWRTRSTISTQ